MSAEPRSTVDYRQRLGFVGRFLDHEELQSVVIIEVEGGMLVRATREGHREPELFEFADAEPESWDAPGEKRMGLRRLRRDDELFHDGYAASFQTLGRLFDLTGASQVTITEGDRYLAVGALYPFTQEDGSEGYSPVSDILLLDDVRRLHAGELPAHLIEPEPTAAKPTGRWNPGSVSLPGSMGRVLGKLRAALAGFAARGDRESRRSPQRAAAD